MIVNYHAHTYRCGHAEGNERDYAEKAVQAGLRTLGISDHTPYDFFDAGPRDRPMRMKPEELPEYADSVRALAEEYRGKLDVLLGLEAEYYPRYFPRLLELLRDAGIQYIILGQHFLNNEVDGQYCGTPSPEAAALERYVSQSREAMETGLYTYFAHPDLLWYTGPGEIYEEEMTKLCRFCKEIDIPLEINLLGVREDRNYPGEHFWKIAAREGNSVIYGSDAHHADHVYSPEVIAKADRFLLRCGIPRERLIEVI